MTHIHKLTGLILLIFVLLSVAPLMAQESYVRPEWDGVSRFTVLIAGIDRRPDEDKTLIYRTDAIMVASIDPATNSVGILSIPRDMNFALAAGGELVAVNTLLVRGESLQEGYGPFFMMDTIQYNLGIYIDTYVLFDFEAFTAVIDALGGIEIDVPNFINDPNFPDMNYGYDPFVISPGKHVFDGRTALKYARTRHSDNDYLRGQRQLQVVTAIRDRLMSPGVLAGMIPQVPALMDELSGNVYTDITPEELLRLAEAALKVPPEYIFTGAIDEKNSLPVGTPGGTVRVPDREKLGDLMVYVFGDFAS